MAINEKGGSGGTRATDFALHAALLQESSAAADFQASLDLGDFSGLQDIITALFAYLEGMLMEGDYALTALPEDINSVSCLLPNDAAQAYMAAIDEKRDQITVRYHGSDEDVTLTLQEYVEDDRTGFRGAIYMDSNGHSIVFYGGMDEMKNAIAAGKDITTIAQANSGSAGDQFGQARALFDRAVSLSKTVEVVGYSMGSMYANRLGAEGVKAITISDIGLPDLKNASGQSFFGPEHHQNIAKNVTALNIQNDPFVGFVGPVHGRTVILNSTADALSQDTQAARSAFNILQPEAHLPIAYHKALQNNAAIAPVPSSSVVAVATLDNNPGS